MSNFQVGLKIKLLSDYHLGTGFGLARNLDDRLLKDERGLPYLPGSTIKALIRDAAERLFQLKPLEEVAICDGEYGYRKEQEARIKKAAAQSDTPSDQLVITEDDKGAKKYLCGVAPLPLKDNPLKYRPLDWFCPLCRVFGTTFVPGSFAFSAAYLPAEETEWANQLALAEVKSQLKIPMVLDNAARSATMKAVYNRIDRQTGRAEDEKLFSFELGKAGLQFQATITELYYPNDPLARRQNWLILAAGSAYVEELGKRRRRGSGQCHFDLNLAKLPATFQSELSLTRPPVDLLNGLAELKQIADNTRPFSPSQVLETPSAVVEYSTPTTTSRYIVVAYTEEPIIISSQAEAGNTISSLDYINGTSLRGAIANLFLQQYQSLRVGQLPDRAREIFVALFGKEAVRFSNLLPAKFSLEKDSQMEVGTLQASIPAPRSVFTCKLHRGPLKKATLRPDVPHGLTDYLLDKPIPDHCGYVMDQDKKQECDAALERFSGFLLPGEDSTAWRKPVTLELRYEVVMHNEVDDRTGRAEDGRLFSYKVLQRGQWFAGVIEELEDEGLLGELMAALEIPTGGGEIRVRLGRATRRGQGEVRLRFIPQPFETEADYQPALLVGTSLSERFSRQHKLLTLTLMSDCILQDELLCYLDYLPASYLIEWAGLPKGSLTEWVGLPKDSLTEWAGLPKDSLIEIDEQNQQPMRRYRSTRLVEGWNVAHGLPRETEMAIEAGSVFSYRLLPPALENYDLVLKALQRLERVGIGERRDEGFGRLVFNHPLHEKLRQLSKK